MGNCRHAKGIVVRGGTLHPDERLFSYEAAWCPTPGCGAFREEQAFKGPNPWILPGQKIEDAAEGESVRKKAGKKSVRKKAGKRARKSDDEPFVLTPPGEDVA